MCHVSHVINETKSPAYGRHWISWHVQIISPKIRLGRSCFLMFYSALLITDPHPTSFTTLEKKWNEKHLPKSVYLSNRKKCNINLMFNQKSPVPPLSESRGESPDRDIYSRRSKTVLPFLILDDILVYTSTWPFTCFNGSME